MPVAVRKTPYSENGLMPRSSASVRPLAPGASRSRPSAGCRSSMPLICSVPRIDSTTRPTSVSTTTIASATNGARKRGFSRTRSNTAVGSNNTRTRSRTAPIAPSRTQGSPSRTAGTAPNIREKQNLRAGGAQDDRCAAFLTSFCLGLFSPSRGAPRLKDPLWSSPGLMWRQLPPRPKLDRELDQHANGPSANASPTETRLQDGVPRGLIEPGVGALDHPHRSGLGAAGRVDDGAHHHPSLNPGLAQQVGVLERWSREEHG